VWRHSHGATARTDAMPRTLPDDLTQMPADERLQLIDALWDSLDEGQVPVSEEQLAELNRRRDAADVSREGYREWADVKADMIIRQPHAQDNN
jgi:putative addiction module component (TIGR02574 family)